MRSLDHGKYKLIFEHFIDLMHRNKMLKFMAVKVNNSNFHYKLEVAVATVGTPELSDTVEFDPPSKFCWSVFNSEGG